MAVGCTAVVGCMTAKVGTDYAAISQKIGPPKAGHSRVVVLQQKRDGLSMSLCACEVRLDGSPMGKVLVATYAYADLPAGPHQLTATELMFPGRAGAISLPRPAGLISSSSSPAHGMMPSPARPSSRGWPAPSSPPS